MKYVNLGASGLKVSRIALGMMTFGTGEWRPWIRDEATAREVTRKAVELGVNFFDTADLYSIGTSEEITGRMVREFARREEVVVATKVFFPNPEARAEVPPGEQQDDDPQAELEQGPDHLDRRVDGDDQQHDADPTHALSCSLPAPSASGLSAGSSATRSSNTKQRPS